jgi:putative oxidoreductase
MQQSRRFLLIGGVATAIASALHVGIVLGGPAWYRFFGAGERMARLAARGSVYPTIVTLVIAAILGLWALYAFSGAGVIRRLPFLRSVLGLVAAIFLARGLFGIPAVLIVDDPYMRELRGKMVFMVVSSLVCVGLGLCYGLGAARVRRT